MAESPDRDHWDERAMEIFSRAIRELGGAETMVKRGEQEVLPALMESAYALVLHDEAGLSYQEIARELDISVGAVEAVFEAPMESAMARIRYRASEDEEFDRHMDPDWSGTPMTPRQDMEYLAGAVAKFAYDTIKRERAH